VHTLLNFIDIPSRNRKKQEFGYILTWTVRLLTALKTISKKLVARPCDENGGFLSKNAPPSQQESDTGFEPFESREAFHLAEWIFELVQNTSAEVSELLRIWKSHNLTLNIGESPPFGNYEDVLTSIDNITVGSADWFSFTVRYNGDISEDSPNWQHEKFTVHTRSVRTVLRNILGTRELDGKIDYAAYEEFVQPDVRLYGNFMSGQWAYKESV
jgi:hypothetical protein